MKKFTLIEILFVITILVIIIGISWVSGAKILRKSANTQINAELKMIQSAIDLYKTDKGFYPSKNNIVNQIRDLKVIKISDGQFIDPYDEPYKYITNEDGFFKVYSQSQN